MWDVGFVTVGLKAHSRGWVLMLRPDPAGVGGGSHGGLTPSYFETSKWVSLLVTCRADLMKEQDGYERGKQNLWGSEKAWLFVSCRSGAVREELKCAESVCDPCSAGVPCGTRLGSCLQSQCSEPERQLERTAW